MHTTILVTTSTSTAATSRAARVHVYETLSRDSSFVDPEGGAITDWFVIGGRASGILTRIQRQPLEEPRHGSGWVLVHADDLERDPHRRLGYHDDAMLVDELLYIRLLSQFQGLNRVYVGPTKDLVFFDLDGQPVERGFIGSKWIVVLDCHS